MFENRAFEVIRDEMLDEVSNDVDKRPGAIIYDAVAPTALKLANMYSDLDVFLSLVFADTADGDYLTRRAAEYGVFRHLATRSIREGIFKDSNDLFMDIPIGSRFSFENLIFEAIEKIQSGKYKLRAIEPGSEGNIGVGILIPIEPIDGLGTAELSEVITPGTDEESDESLYSRYQIRVQKQATSGNVYHYEQWALSVPGVGGVKVIPTWDGPGTVKVVLLSTDKTPASQSIVDDTYNFIENERPIGAEVTAVAATALQVNVSAKITLASGYSLEEAESQFADALKEYLKNKAFEDELLRYTQIANLLLDVPPIIDYEDLLVNGSVANIEPDSVEVGVLGTVTFNE